MASRRSTRASLETVVGTCVERYGLARKGAIFCSRGDVVRALDVQWDNARRKTCTINCGVYVSRVTSRYFGQPENGPTTIALCSLHARLGSLGTGFDKWWDFSSVETESERVQLVHEMVEAIEAYAVPLWEQFPNRASVADYLVQQLSKNDVLDPRSDAIRLAYASFLWDALGDQARGDSCMREACLKGKRTPVAEVLTQIAERRTLENQDCPR